MEITKTDKKKVSLLVKTFLANNKLEEWDYKEIIYINDISKDHEYAANIKILENDREFQIRVYLAYCSTLKDVYEFVLHELTHLYLYEINAFRNMLARHDANEFFIKEAYEMYETVTIKVTKIFTQIYLEGI